MRPPAIAPVLWIYIGKGIFWPNKNNKVGSIAPRRKKVVLEAFSVVIILTINIGNAVFSSL